MSDTDHRAGKDYGLLEGHHINAAQSIRNLLSAYREMDTAQEHLTTAMNELVTHQRAIDEWHMKYGYGGPPTAELPRVGPAPYPGVELTDLARNRAHGGT